MTETDLRTARILIVDDEDLLVEMLTRILEGHGYSDIRSTSDPREAPALVREFRPDLIILDWMMPEMSGAQVLDALRTVIPATSYLPILVLTGVTNSQVKRQALTGGASDFLIKPFDPEEIVLRVDNMATARLLHLQLQEKEHRLQALFENVHDAIVVADDQGRYVDANPAACALFGYSREELLRQRVEDLAPVEKTGPAQSGNPEPPAASQHFHERVIHRRDQTSVWAESRSVAHFLPGLHLSVMRDITERKEAEAEREKAEEALRESERRLRQVLGIMPAAIFTCDADGLVTYFNEHATRLWGRAPELNKTEDRYCGACELARPDGSPVPRELSWTAVALKEQRPVIGQEIVVRRPDGELRHSPWRTPIPF